jgi:hypothetical protein
MHVVIRKYQGNSTLADVLERHRAEVERLIRGVPGFVAYYVVRAADGTTTIGVFRDPAGAQKSTRIARDWVQQNAPEAAGAPPEIIEGATAFEFGA